MNRTSGKFTITVFIFWHLRTGNSFVERRLLIKHDSTEDNTESGIVPLRNSLPFLLPFLAISINFDDLITEEEGTCHPPPQIE